MSLPEPTLEYVERRLGEVNRDSRFTGVERAVEMVFQQWSLNVDDDEVLIKVVVLNRLYSTNIYDPYTIASHITTLDIDDRLMAGDPQLVPDIGKVPLGGKKTYFLSFATKYCSWHQPMKFQIFDSYVEWILWKYKKQFGFADFYKYQLREYPVFVSVIEQFVSRFGLEVVNRKDLDKFLWSEGVKHWT